MCLSQSCDLVQISPSSKTKPMVFMTNGRVRNGNSVWVDTQPKTHRQPWFLLMRCYCRARPTCGDSHTNLHTIMTHTVVVFFVCFILFFCSFKFIMIPCIDLYWLKDKNKMSETLFWISEAFYVTLCYI